MTRLLFAALVVSSAAAAQTAPSGRPTPPRPAPVPETFLDVGPEADPADPSPTSGVARAGARFAGVYAHVVYGRPYSRGRTVFGDVVPFDRVWETGAYHATEIVVTAPVRFGGRRLNAGVYSLFTTPRPGRWSVHLNAGHGLRSVAEYTALRDILSVDVIPETLAEPVPALTIDFVPAGDGVDLRVRWDRTGIRVPIHPVVHSPGAPTEQP